MVTSTESHNQESVLMVHLFLFVAYRSRVHALPPHDALRSMMPYANERMRKRRCFADKELEVAMFEREKHMEAEKMKATGILQTTALNPAQQRHLLAHMAPRDFLQRIFPTVNPNVLELVWQGCGGNIERAIEQIASSSNLSSAHASQMVQHAAAMRQRMAANAVAAAAAAAAATQTPGTAELGEITNRDKSSLPPIMTSPMRRSPSNTDTKTVHSAFTPPILRTGAAPRQPTSMMLPQTADGGLLYPPSAAATMAAYQALFARRALLASHPGTAIGSGQAQNSDFTNKLHTHQTNTANHHIEMDDDIFAEKSAFSATSRVSVSVDHDSSSSSGPSPSPSTSSNPSLSPTTMHHQGSKASIKFSVDSIMGKC